MSSPVLSSPAIPATSGSASPRKAWWSHLYVQVLIAIALGVALGYFRPDIASSDAVKALGDGFVKLIRMIIAPIIFCTVVVGIAGMESMKKVGRVGLTAIIYFEVMTTIALIVGLVVINVLHPGIGANIDPKTIDPHQIATFTAAAAHSTTTQFLLDIIPESFVGAFAKGDILPVLFLAVLFGFALFRLGETGKPVLDLIDRTGKVMFGIVGVIMRAAPIGAFGAMAYVVSKFGIGSLWYPIYLLIIFYVTSILFVLVIFGLVARWAGFSIIAFVRYIKEELLLVLGTSSSESALPRLMAKLENLGCEKSVVGLVVPTGYSFNLDGTTLYLALSAIFVAQATNTSLTIGDQLAIMAVLILTSKGAAGVTGAGFTTLVATLSVIPTIPVVGITTIQGIDKFMSECRALTNLVGNGVATIVVSKLEGALDVERMNRVLSFETEAEADNPESMVA
ncbi:MULTISPECIES: dicarboxylate/amino acid:cation symporter [unclassified Beijerinckia]|uniref:dicarboxylate/amino acid:cation symporter n=1 Tax=unclassified Beijerinckia TaxID=2638183 RepID=UPI0008954C58|nr:MULTISPECIES: dicarboxylate/amino acid:cation symporter [unclassified Beijerinckia]MDH7795694.1 aerobic C4-dicarboxylate transport protein [Beijerinckia sp. GAS462]SEC12164.1 aerobic C4-dicarboxylate transport protein [Beijerinckia sp. 28-YEA-48]